MILFLFKFVAFCAELFVILAVLWFIANVIRYLFFKNSPGGKIFVLSDKWLGKK